MSERRWVLVTADGPQVRNSLVAVRAVAEAGYRAAIALSCRSSLAQFSRFCERVYRVPSTEDPDYAAAVHGIVYREGFLTVIPGSEAGLNGLGVGEPHLDDKARLAEHAERVGIPSPPSRLFSGREELLAAAGQFEYPVILKPTVRSAIAVRCDSPAEVAATSFDDPVIVQPYLRLDLGAVCGVLWKGRIVAAAHERWLRTWRVDSGVACAAVTTEPDRELERRLARLMEGFDGLFTAQFIGPYLMDLNLHHSSTLPLSVKAGVNMIGIWCDIMRGEEVAEVRARPGVHFRWLDADVRSILVEVRRGRMRAREALRALRPQPGCAHPIESLRDPLPMVRRSAYLAGRALGMAR